MSQTANIKSKPPARRKFSNGFALWMLFLLLAFATSGCAQRRNYTFRVVDAETQQPIPGAQVSEMSTVYSLQPGAGAPIIVLMPWPHPVEDQQADDQGLVSFPDVPESHYFWVMAGDDYHKSTVHKLDSSISVDTTAWDVEISPTQFPGDFDGVITVPLQLTERARTARNLEQ